MLPLPEASGRNLVEDAVVFEGLIAVDRLHPKEDGALAAIVRAVSSAAGISSASGSIV